MSFMDEIIETFKYTQGLSTIYDTMSVEDYVKMQCETVFNFLTNEDRWKSMMRCAAKNGHSYVDIYEYSDETYYGPIQFCAFKARGTIKDTNLISMIESRLKSTLTIKV